MSAAQPDDAELDALLDAAATDLAADGRPRTGDDALIARSVEGAMRRAKASHLRGSALQKRWIHVGIAVAAGLLASGAFAVIERARDAKPVSEPIQPMIEALPPAAPVPTALLSDPGAVPKLDPPVERSLEPTAAELFAQANEARRRGDAAGAVQRYGALQRRFPRSPEASLSHVALGRLVLDRLGDPLRALAEFDAYLAENRKGELVEEALVGRALSLQRLGRTADERDAWRALVVAFPNSLSASLAKARLAVLR
jgi:TolA-binding protein